MSYSFYWTIPFAKTNLNEAGQVSNNFYSAGRQNLRTHLGTICIDKVLQFFKLFDFHFGDLLLNFVLLLRNCQANAGSRQFKSTSNNSNYKECKQIIVLSNCIILTLDIVNLKFDSMTYFYKLQFVLRGFISIPVFTSIKGRWQILCRRKEIVQIKYQILVCCNLLSLTALRNRKLGQLQEKWI